MLKFAEAVLAMVVKESPIRVMGGGGGALSVSVTGDIV